MIRILALFFLIVASAAGAQVTVGPYPTTVDLTKQVTGTLPVANGGTGASSTTGAISSLGLFVPQTFTYTASGSYVFTVPSGCSFVRFRALAPGGPGAGGGRDVGTSCGGSSGQGGGFTDMTFTAASLGGAGATEAVVLDDPVAGGAGAPSDGGTGTSPTSDFNGCTFGPQTGGMWLAAAQAGAAGLGGATTAASANGFDGVGTFSAGLSAASTTTTGTQGVNGLGPTGGSGGSGGSYSSGVGHASGRGGKPSSPTLGSSGVPPPSVGIGVSGTTGASPPLWSFLGGCGGNGGGSGDGSNNAGNGGQGGYGAGGGGGGGVVAGAGKTAGSGGAGGPGYIEIDCW